MTVTQLDRRDAVDAAAVAIMIILTFSWGLNGVASKVANTGFNPVLVSVLRSAIAGTLVFAWCRIRGIPLFERDGTLWPGLLAGFLFGAEFLCIFIAFDYTSVGRGALLINAMPFWVLVGAHFLLGERLTPKKVAGVALAFAGVYVIFSDRLSAPGPDAWIGDLLTLAAGMLWGATSLVIKSTRLNSTGPEKLLLYQLAIAGVMSLPLLAFAGPLLRYVSAANIFALLFQAVFVVGFTYLVWFCLMRRYPASGLASFAFLTPAFSVLLGGLLLGETLTWKVGLALLLIAAGLTIVNRPARAGMRTP